MKFKPIKSIFFIISYKNVPNIDNILQIYYVIYIMKNTISNIDEGLFYKEIGKIIRIERKNRSLTQEELSELLNASRTSITNIERGNQKVPLHMMYAIAIALEIDIQRLIPESASILAKINNQLISVGNKQEDVEAKSADIFYKIAKKLNIQSSKTQDTIK